jgi:carboxyl-terminal processing protease
VSESRINLRNPFIYMLIMGIGMFLGYRMHSSINGNGANNVGSSAGNLGEIMSLVQQRYVDTIATDSIEGMAIDQLLAQLDPHSVYIPAKDMKAVDDDLGGSFEGVGIEFYLLRDTLTVTSVISGGPSAEAGVESGDKIIKVDDSIVSGKKISDEAIIKSLRGRGGTKVRLQILRNGKMIKNVTVTRGLIPLYSIDAAYLLDSTTGYIKINRFAEKTYDEFMEKVQEFKKKNVTKLVIDLRDNPGGYLDAACSIADEFISGKKLLVYTRGRKNQQETYKSGKQGIFETGKVAVLIDEGSASAAEILSGDIQDHDRGIIIGRRSFGKGLVQEQFPLENGGALRLTIARYYLPSGRCIQKDYSDGLNSYRGDVMDRYKHGEMMSQDSIHHTDTTMYKTLGGKRVYGGGGIIPDIFIPLDTNKYSRALSDILASGYISDITNDYISANKSALKNFTSAKSIMDGFKETPELISAIKKKCIDNKIPISSFSNTNDLQLITTRIKAQIAKSILGNTAQYEVANQNDEFISKALQSLK